MRRTSLVIDHVTHNTIMRDGNALKVAAGGGRVQDDQLHLAVGADDEELNEREQNSIQGVKTIEFKYTARAGSGIPAASFSFGSIMPSFTAMSRDRSEIMGYGNFSPVVPATA